MPTTMPYCWDTLGSDTVFSMRPKSGVSPVYLLKSGTILLIATVSVGYFTAVPARVVPNSFGTFAPSGVTSFEHAATLYVFALAT